MPPLFQILVDTYGWRGGCLVMSAIMCNAVVGAIMLRSTPLMKVHQGHKETSNDDKNTSSTDANNLDQSQSLWRKLANDFQLSLWHNWRFICVALTGVGTGMGYNAALISVVPYADDIGVDQMRSSFLLSIVGIGSIVGRLLHGPLIDNRLALPAHLGSVSWGASAVIIFIFPFVKTYSKMVILGAMFGFFTGIALPVLFVLFVNSVGTQRASGAFAWWLLLEAPGSLIGIYLSGKFMRNAHDMLIGRFRYVSPTTYTERICADVISRCVVFISAACYPSFLYVRYVWKPVYTYSLKRIDC